MLKQERLDTILALLQKEKYLTVDRLAETLHYSHATVRRDLALLVKAGLAGRSYGGISLNERAKPVMLRGHEDVPEKEKLCRAAAAMINDGDTVFIAGSSTTRHFAGLLSDKQGLIVVTQDLYLAAELAAAGIRVFCTGGLVRDEMLVGVFAVQLIKQLRFDVSLFSVSGISKDGELTVVSEAFGELMTEVLARSKKNVCLCVDEKIGKESFFSLGALDCVDCLIGVSPFDGTLTERFCTTRFIHCGQ